MTSILKVDRIQHSNSTTPSVGSLGVNIHSVDLPSGSVLQVQSDVRTSSTGIASSSWVDTGLEVSITPRSTNSKFILAVSLTGSTGYFSFGIRLVRDGSPITESLGNASGNKTQATMSHNDYNVGSGDTTNSNQYQMHTLAGSFHDNTSASDTTTPIVFKVQWYSYAAGAVNRSVEDADNSSRHRCTSSLVVYEFEK